MSWLATTVLLIPWIVPLRATRKRNGEKKKKKKKEKGKKKGKKKKKRKKEKGKKKRRDVGIKNAEISVIKAANEMTPCIHLMDQFIRDWTRIEFLETFRFETI